MLPLVAAHPHNAVNLLVVAWAFLGVGAVLYLVVTAALFIRSISHPLPPAGLAPTLFIGTGPAGLLGLDLLRLAEAGNKVGVAGPELVAAALPAKRSRALTIATATVEPPLRPAVTIQGTVVTCINASLLSTVLTKPTGTPITRAGWISSSIRCSTS